MATDVSSAQDTVGVLHLSVQEILQMVVFPALGIVVWYFREAVAKLEKQIEALEDTLVHQKNNISQWQLQIVQNYVTKNELERLEMRILSALDRLSEKVEKAMLRETRTSE